jgi:hypothetical protein
MLSIEPDLYENQIIPLPEHLGHCRALARRLAVLRLKNRALMDLMAERTRLYFGSGHYSLKLSAYEGLIVALARFYAETLALICASDDTWANFHDYGCGSADLDAALFEYFGGGQTETDSGARSYSLRTERSALRDDVALWQRHGLIYEESDIENRFWAWCRDYEKLPSRVFAFDMFAFQDVQYNSMNGQFIVELFFQEAFFNALKYSGRNSAGRAAIQAEVSCEGDQLRLLRILNPYRGNNMKHAHTPTRRTGARGHSFLEMFLSDGMYLGLSPFKNAKGKFMYIDDSTGSFCLGGGAR